MSMKMSTSETKKHAALTAIPSSTLVANGLLKSSLKGDMRITRTINGPLHGIYLLDKNVTNYFSATDSAAMANSWNGGTTTINPTTLGNRSSGYDSYNAVIGQMGANIGTSGAPHNNSDDKWTRWFGIPPYSNFQKDNYAELGHENYTLPTAYIGRNLHIEKLLNVSIASNDDFYTRVLLPWQQCTCRRIYFMLILFLTFLYR